MKIIRWPLVILAALIFAAPGPTPGGFGLGGNPRSNRGLPLFSFASASGAGLPVAQNLCDALTSADKEGIWWCVQGGLTQSAADGGTPMAVQGGLAPQTVTVCPSGPRCGSFVGERNDGSGDGLQESGSDYTFPQSDVSVCELRMFDEFLNAQDVSFGTSGATASFAMLPFEIQTNGTFRVYTSNGTTSAATSNSAIAMVKGAWHLLCTTYRRVGDGSSVVELYLDGVDVGGHSTAKLIHALSSRWATCAYVGSHGCSSGNTRGAFVTYKELSAARIAAIARAVLADTPTGTKGEAMTFTRATPRACPLDANESEVTMLPAGRPCITRGGISIFRAGTNLALRSEEFDNAAWTKNVSGASAAPTVTANGCTAPDGTATAERIQFASCAATIDASDVYQGVGSGSVSTTGSIWLKANSGTPSISLCTFAGAAGNCVQYALTNGWVRYAKTFTGIAGTNYLNFGCEHRTALYSGSADTGAADVCAWGGDIETSPYPTPYVATAGASATRNAETATFPDPGSSIASAGCGAATIIPGWTGSQLVGDGVSGNAGIVTFANQGRPIYYRGSTGVGIAYDGTNAPTHAAAASAGVALRLGGSWTGSALTVHNHTAGTSTAGTFDGTMTTAAIELGNAAAFAGQIDSLIHNVTISTSPTGCR